MIKWMKVYCLLILQGNTLVSQAVIDANDTLKKYNKNNLAMCHQTIITIIEAEVYINLHGHFYAVKTEKHQALLEVISAYIISITCSMND